MITGKLSIHFSKRKWFEGRIPIDKPITDYETFSAIYKYYAAQFGLELREKADKTSAASNPCYFSL